VFTLRFDFRLGPASPCTMQELYSTALDMAAWAEGAGASAVVLSEHHDSPDGYLPSPLVLAAAAAARTTTLPLNVAALLALMYDPVKLAEDMAVLDHLSGGRVSYVIGLGYRAEEFAMFGVDPTRRAALIEEHLDVLKRALTGERFEWRGRSIHVTPEPLTVGGPLLIYGGGSAAAARRAARFGMLFLPQTSDPTLAAAYDAEATRVGHSPGLTMAPPAGAPQSVFVVDDVDAAWPVYGPHLLHDAVIYNGWMRAAGEDTVVRSVASTIDELRTENGSYRLVTVDGARELLAAHGTLGLQPLCGGLPPDLAWQSLHLVGSLAPGREP
jgi:alkanesulfonate monooxygenase SsuD/methylene tetrahydromethanopterin reductase-like flavin-dependent oxidoreductase (luciferase family)